MSSQNVYVVGHCHPDTDSIASVIGYAELLNRKEPGRYIPARCGELNHETRYVLSKFQLQPPELIESVEPSVADIPFLYPHRAPEEMPAIDVALMMDEHDIRNIPVVNNKGRVIGLVSEYGLAKAYVTPERREQLIIGPISQATLARILEAEVLVSCCEELNGRVVIVIDALHNALSSLTVRDVAITGDNEPSQLALISAGIAALIVAEGAPVGERVLTAAQARNVSILATPLDAFSVGRMIHLSRAAGQVMATDIPMVRPEDPLAYAKQMVSNSRYRTACVVDGDGLLLGMISRNTFLEEIHKSVILLDHNEFTQSVDGIESAEILEIIDHHRLGAITTLKPVSFLNEPVGSTSTIITQKFMDEGLAPSVPAAGMLLAGILSDTLGLRMSTTTGKDKKAVSFLAGITGLDPAEFGTTLIKQGMDLVHTAPRDILTADIKHYSLFGRDVIIAQVMTASDDYALSRADEVRNELEILRKEFGVHLYLVLFTNVMGNTSYLLAAGDKNTLLGLEYMVQPVRLDGVMSRKKDFLPVFGQKLRLL
ncbi:MAG: putative manganese-dependent inorganic diphosphatase [Methanoregulaceae archaeon]|jgi:manganese-dependent inorganic pyrophosphatase|nr:putative manganese-dependent inorganic diphosphatase [Methanoregulaceae archaeon]